jgi:hypothetical protein
MSGRTATKRGGRAVAALFLCLAAPFAWIPTLDVPWMRSSGAPAWLLLAVGLALGWSALRADPRLGTRILFGLDVLALVLFAAGFFAFARLPMTERALSLARAENFTLPDETGRDVSLRAELTRGPVLLVFYRGHW